jgi:Tfp pilus assembly protein PilF
VENADDEMIKLQIRVNSYALMGDIYHQLGQDDKAFLAYDSCLVYKQNDAMVLNNYAYYLSLKQKDLKRAEEMSRLSNELEPDNATYLDTYAWVLFQQKRYEEAKQYMDKVVELMERDGEEMSDDVLDHIKQINKKVKKK